MAGTLLIADISIGIDAEACVIVGIRPGMTSTFVSLVSRALVVNAGMFDGIAFGDTTLLIADVLINMRIAEFVGTLASVVSDTGVDVFAGVDVDT